MLTDALHDPWLVGMAAFALGALVLGVVLAVTSTRHWHDRHHQNRTELMCDKCMARHWEDPRNSPPLRVLGDPRQ